MSDAPDDSRSTSAGAGPPDEPVRYPINQVLAVFDTEERLAATVEALTSSAFLNSEIDVQQGSEAAARLDGSTGRRGLAGLAIRVAERLGIENDEMHSKEQYEQALRDGRYVLRVVTPTEERRDLASRILHDHGAELVRFFGRFSITTFNPPRTR